MQTWQRPYQSAHGIWVVPVGSPSLCLICGAAKDTKAGGLVCGVDPLRIAETRVCRSYVGVPGLHDLWGRAAG